MIPVVERIVRATADPDQKDSDEETADRHSCALERLAEIAPEAAVPYFVDEVNDPDSELQLRVFGGLKVATLPQLDKVLFGQIQTFAAAAAKEAVTNGRANRDVIEAQASLKDRTLLAARYASPAVFAPMLDLYRQYSAKWYVDQRDARDAMLAYLLRWDAAKAMPLLRAAVMPDDNFFSGAVAKVGEVYSYIPMAFPPELRAYLLGMVERGSYEEVQTAALQLSLHGLPEDEPVLEKRLAAIQAELKLHPEKPEESPAWGTPKGPAGAESALIGALRTDQVWHPSESELIALKQDCVGTICAQVKATAIQVAEPGY
jgi:hypothetical protein